jgi:hypothetical protein
MEQIMELMMECLLAEMKVGHEEMTAEMGAHREEMNTPMIPTYKG